VVDRAARDLTATSLTYEGTRRSPRAPNLRSKTRTFQGREQSCGRRAEGTSTLELRGLGQGNLKLTPVSSDAMHGSGGCMLGLTPSQCHCSILLTEVFQNSSMLPLNTASCIRPEVLKLTQKKKKSKTYASRLLAQMTWRSWFWLGHANACKTNFYASRECSIWLAGLIFEECASSLAVPGLGSMSRATRCGIAASAITLLSRTRRFMLRLRWLRPC